MNHELLYILNTYMSCISRQSKYRLSCNYHWTQHIIIKYEVFIQLVRYVETRGVAKVYKSSQDIFTQLTRDLIPNDNISVGQLYSNSQKQLKPALLFLHKHHFVKESKFVIILSPLNKRVVIHFSFFLR